jgi:hypothetical protein
MEVNVHIKSLLDVDDDFHVEPPSGTSLEAVGQVTSQHAFSGENFFLSFCTSFSGKNQSINPQVPQTRR